MLNKWVILSQHVSSKDLSEFRHSSRLPGGFIYFWTSAFSYLRVELPHFKGKSNLSSAPRKIRIKLRLIRSLDLTGGFIVLKSLPPLWCNSHFNASALPGPPLPPFVLIRPSLSPHLALYTSDFSVGSANSWLMHCFINLPKGPLRPGLCPFLILITCLGSGTQEHFIPLLFSPECIVQYLAAFGFFSCSQYFSLVYVYTLLITADKQCVVYIWQKKDHGRKFATLLSIAGGFSSFSQGVLSLFQKFWILPQVYFRFSWLLKRLKRSRIGAWPPGLGVAVDSTDRGWYYTGWHENTDTVLASLSSISPINKAVSYIQNSNPIVFPLTEKFNKPPFLN